MKRARLRETPKGMINLCEIHSGTSNIKILSFDPKESQLVMKI